MNSFYRRFLHVFTIVPIVLFTLTTLCVISWAQENQQSSQQKPVAPAGKQKTESDPSPLSLSEAKLTAEDLSVFLDGLVVLLPRRVHHFRRQVIDGELLAVVGQDDRPFDDLLQECCHVSTNGVEGIVSCCPV